MCALSSDWPGVNLRFCQWLLLVKYWTGMSDPNSIIYSISMMFTYSVWWWPINKRYTVASFWPVAYCQQIVTHTGQLYSLEEGGLRSASGHRTSGIHTWVIWLKKSPLVVQSMYWWSNDHCPPSHETMVKLPMLSLKERQVIKMITGLPAIGDMR